MIGNNMNNQITDYSVCMASPDYVSKIKTINSEDILFDMKSKDNDSTEKVKGFEMVCSIVAGEMPCEYSDEALKAQAVASLSYCLYKKNIQKQDFIIKGVNVAYLSKDEARKEWGKSFENNWSKIEKCVADVYPYVMKYQSEIVDAYFFSTSSGKTENSKDVFNVEKPYLVSVDCKEDTADKDYKSIKIFKLENFKNTLYTYNKNADFKCNPKDYIKNIRRSEAGGIISLEVCSLKMSGLEFRELFDLRSTNIAIEYKENSFTFTVLGYGHGVGMSQTEANYLAIKGYNWKDILKHFYKDVEFHKYFGENMITD